MPGTLIGASVAHQGPAIVAAGLQDVDLVAAVGAVFVLPHLTGAGIHRQAQRAAMPQRIDFRPVTGLPDERIIGRDGAVVAQAQHFAAERVGILRIFAGGGQVKHAVAAESNARSAGFVQNKNVLHVGERAAIQSPARDRSGPFSSVQRLGVSEVEEVILREVRMERDVHISVHRARPARFSGPIRCRSAGDGLRIEHTLANNPQSPGALGHQHASVRKKRGAPGIFKRLRDHHNADLLSFRRIEFHRMIRQRTMGKTGWRDRNVELAIPSDLLLGESGSGHERECEQNARRWMFHIDIDPIICARPGVNGAAPDPLFAVSRQAIRTRRAPYSPAPTACGKEHLFDSQPQTSWLSG